MKNFFKGLWDFIEILIILYVIIVTACILCKNSRGFTQFGPYLVSTIHEEDVNNISNSEVNDLLIIKSDDEAEINDYFFYYVDDNGTSSIVGDVVDGYTDGTYTLRFQGTTISDEYYIGKSFDTIPKLGGILDVLKTKSGYLLYVILPLVVVLIVKLIELSIKVKNKNKDKKEEDKEDKEEIEEEEKVEDKKEEDSEEHEEKKDEDEEIDLGNMIEDNKEEDNDEVL